MSEVIFHVVIQGCVSLIPTQFYQSELRPMAPSNLSSLAVHQRENRLC